MTLEEAAASLRNHLAGENWFATVGLTNHQGKPALMITVNSEPVEQTFNSREFEGFPVLFRKMGRTKPQ